MARILIVGTLHGDGASVAAAGLAASLRAQGRTVRLARVGHDDHAQADAAQFQRLNGVRANPDPADTIDDIPHDTDHTIIELPRNHAPTRSDRSEHDRLILITRHAEADDDTLSQAIADTNPDGVIVNATPPHTEAAAHARIESLNASPIATLPEDRHLASPIVRDIAPAIDGTLSGDHTLFDEASRDLVVGPVSAHEGMDYFRKYPNKTIVSRHDRIDIALGALDYQPLCLILSGGEPTLPYVAQRAERESFALITTPLTTVETVDAIGPLYGQSPFSGARKLSAAAQLVAANFPMEVLP